MGLEDHSKVIDSIVEDVSTLLTSMSQLRANVESEREQIHDHKVQLLAINDRVIIMSNALSTHIAKEDVVFELYKRTLSAGLATVGVTITTLIAAIGFLLTHPEWPK